MTFNDEVFASIGAKKAKSLDQELEEIFSKSRRARTHFKGAYGVTMVTDDEGDNVSPTRAALATYARAYDGGHVEGARKALALLSDQLDELEERARTGQQSGLTSVRQGTATSKALSRRLRKYVNTEPVFPGLPTIRVWKSKP